MKKLTDFDKENINNLYMQNYKANYIADFLEIPVSLINKFIQENQLRKSRDSKNLLLLKQLCSENYTKQEVAEKLNLTEERVYFLTKKYNLQPHFREKIYLVRKDKIISEYKNKPCSIKEMSAKLKLPVQFVRDVYKENKLKNIIPHYTNKMSVLSEAQYLDLLEDLKNTKLSLQKLSDKYKISRQRIHQIQKKENIIRGKEK